MTISLTSFPGIPDSVAAARRFVTGMLRLCPQTSAPDEVVHRVELIVSELCTNAIHHTPFRGSRTEVPRSRVHG